MQPMQYFSPYTLRGRTVDNEVHDNKIGIYRTNRQGHFYVSLIYSIIILLIKLKSFYTLVQCFNNSANCTNRLVSMCLMTAYLLQTFRIKMAYLSNIYIYIDNLCESHVDDWASGDGGSLFIITMLELQLQ